MIYAGIGSRQTPQHILDIMTEIASQLSPDWMLRSGHADGADMAFEKGCLQEATANGSKPNAEIFLPWDGFNKAYTNFFVPQIYHLIGDLQATDEIASHFHPAWDRCSETVKAFHRRNVCQIAGKDLNTPATIVICWTPDGKRGGGTGQALRIAEYLNIPIFDLALDKTGVELCKFVGEYKGSW